MMKYFNLQYIVFRFAPDGKPAGGKRKKRRQSKRSGWGCGRWLIILLALMLAMALGYFLPDYAPGVDRALRSRLPFKAAEAPVAPEPVMNVEVQSAIEDDTFVMPVAEEGDWKTEHLPFGEPRGECVDCTLIVREAYVVMHDNSRKISRWVAWRLDPIDTSGNVPRRDNFREDPLVPEAGRASLSDYRGSGFDRGHVAPAADLKKSTLTMDESFFLSNMLPQTARMNRQEWRMHEEKIRNWLNERQQLWIIAGPGFEGDNATRTIGDGVHVPTHCWKIVVDQLEDGSFESLAIWMPNIEANVPNWQRSQVTIDEIEDFTGLDFFWALPDSIEEELETRMDEW